MRPSLAILVVSVDARQHLKKVARRLKRGRRNRQETVFVHKTRRRQPGAVSGRTGQKAAQEDPSESVNARTRSESP